MGTKPDPRIIDFLYKIRRQYHIEKAILFGSRARGDYLNDSDYDIIIVSPDFEGIFFSQRSARMYDFWEHWPLEIETLCYTPNEFQQKSKQMGIVSEAIRDGLTLPLN